MRFYGFGNYYLSSLQQGLQAAHVISDMAMKCAYECPDEMSGWNQFSDWAKNHKTIVLLNGGNSADLLELYEFLSNPANKYPTALFSEDEQSLNSALTSVGIILPAEIYESAALIRANAILSGTNVDGPFFSKGYEFQDPIKNESVDRCICFLNNASQFELNLIYRLNDYSLAR